MTWSGGRLARPFDVEVGAGRDWLTWLKSKVPSPALKAFLAWLSASETE
ncbi:hypothetical protein [Caulobacter segnis]|nr:hypothetical protein [Caulobacter segnis]